MSHSNLCQRDIRLRPDWAEIHRALVPGGSYFAQHVGPASAFELIEYFLGPLPRQPTGRDPHREAAAAQHAGLVVTDLRQARCRMEFYDVGAVVWILRKCVWWVPDFSVDTVPGHARRTRRSDAPTASLWSHTRPDTSSRRGLTSSVNLPTRRRFTFSYREQAVAVHRVGLHAARFAEAELLQDPS